MAHAEGCPVGCGDQHQRDAWVGGGLGQGELTTTYSSDRVEWVMRHACILVTTITLCWGQLSTLTDITIIGNVLHVGLMLS